MSKAATTHVQIRSRAMLDIDLAWAVEIEKKCFDWPWTQKDYLDLATSQWGRVDCIEVPYKSPATPLVVGVMAYSYWHGKVVIESMAIDPMVQGQGIGSLVLDRFKFVCAQQDRFLEVMVDEIDGRGIQFFVKNGFRPSERPVIRRPFDFSESDGILLQWRLEEHCDE